MKKIAALLIGIVFLSGCCKDIATDIIIIGASQLLEGAGKVKQKNCTDYGTTFTYQKKFINNNTGTKEMKLKDNILYIVNSSGFDRYTINEVDIKSGKTLYILDVDKRKTGSVNSDNTAFENIIFLKTDDFDNSMIAYNIVSHKVLWIKSNSDIKNTIVKDHFYSVGSEWIGGKGHFYINEIEPVSGKETIIYSFEDSIPNTYLSKIEDLNPYLNGNNELCFVYVALHKKSSKGSIFKINALNIANNNLTVLGKYEKNYDNLVQDCIELDKNNLYVNINGDITCYGKPDLSEKWSSFSVSNTRDLIKTIKIEGDYVFLFSYNVLEVLKKGTGEGKFKKSDLHGDIQNVGVYDNFIYVTDFEYFYKLKNSPVEEYKFISPGYCENDHSYCFKFIVENKTGDVILSDGRYLMKKEWDK